MDRVHVARNLTVAGAHVLWHVDHGASYAVAAGQLGLAPRGVAQFSHVQPAEALAGLQRGHVVDFQIQDDEEVAEAAHQVAGVVVQARVDNQHHAVAPQHLDVGQARAQPVADTWLHVQQGQRHL